LINKMYDFHLNFIKKHSFEWFYHEIHNKN